MSDQPIDGTPLPLQGHPTRRGVLKCIAWAGTGVLWTLRAGVPAGIGIGSGAAPGFAQAAGAQREIKGNSLTFLQVSDSHIGFEKPANPDARATYRQAVAKIRQLPRRPAFILHTGDISHLSKDQEFDDADQIIREAGLPVFHIPGEHDLLDDENGRAYRSRYGKGTQGAGWYSFDHGGVHFIALVNVANLQAGGMGSLGAEQLLWLQRDLSARTASTPIVVFAHIPLWTVYPQWGWGTQDSLQALSYLRGFGSVTVLNGHIHQVMQKQEGHIAFYTARSTAFPQPAPGTAPSPGPLTVPAGHLQDVLGIRTLSFVGGRHPLVVQDSALSEPISGQATAVSTASGGVAGATASADATAANSSGHQIAIDNFTFTPDNLTVAPGTTVKWVNGDDIPHTVVAVDKSFRSAALDSHDVFSFTFRRPGEYAYFCSLHPHMTGKVIVNPP